MNALTGEIISFDKSYSYGKDSPNKITKPADDNKVLARANAAAKHFIGAKAAEYKEGESPMYITRRMVRNIHTEM